MLSVLFRLVSDNPGLPPIPVLFPFPVIVSGNGGGIAFRPAHNNRVAFTG
jgi:hypothetical protein